MIHWIPLAKVLILSTLKLQKPMSINYLTICTIKMPTEMLSNGTQKLELKSDVKNQIILCCKGNQLFMRKLFKA